jgi:hypothetical protein
MLENDPNFDRRRPGYTQAEIQARIRRAQERGTMQDVRPAALNEAVRNQRNRLVSLMDVLRNGVGGDGEMIENGGMDNWKVKDFFKWAKDTIYEEVNAGRVTPQAKEELDALNLDSILPTAISDSLKFMKTQYPQGFRREGDRFRFVMDLFTGPWFQDSLLYATPPSSPRVELVSPEEDEGTLLEPSLPASDPASAPLTGSGPFSDPLRNFLTKDVVSGLRNTAIGQVLDSSVTGGLTRLPNEVERVEKNVKLAYDTVTNQKVPTLTEGAQTIWKLNQEAQDPVGYIQKNLPPITFENVNKGLNALIPVQYSDSAFRFLEKYGETLVTEVKIRRAPIAKGLEKAFELISQGHWEEGKKAAGYDAMFHLSLIANGNLFFEKLSKIHLDDKVDKVPMSEYWPVNVPEPVTVNTMLERTRESMGDERYFKYDPFVNNCQQFVRRMLKVNGWLTQELEDWVVQPTEKILEKNPEYLSGFSLLLTNTGALLGLGVGTRNGINFKGGRKDVNKDKPEIQKSNPNPFRILDGMIRRPPSPLPDIDATTVNVNPIRVPVSPEPPPIPPMVQNNRAPSSLPSTPGTGSGRPKRKRGGDRGERPGYVPPKPQKTDQDDEEEEAPPEEAPREEVPQEEASEGSWSSGTPENDDYLMDQGPDEDTQRNYFAETIVRDYFESNPRSARFATDEVVEAMINYMRDVVDEELDNIADRGQYFGRITLQRFQYMRDFNDAIRVQLRQLISQMRHHLRPRVEENN